MHIEKSSTKAIHRCFIKFKYKTSAALRISWENVIQTALYWHQVFKLTYLCAKDPVTKITLSLRFLPYKKWICDIIIVNSNLCEECNTVDHIKALCFLIVN